MGVEWWRIGVERAKYEVVKPPPVLLWGRVEKKVSCGIAEYRAESEQEQSCSLYFMVCYRIYARGSLDDSAIRSWPDNISSYFYDDVDCDWNIIRCENRSGSN